LGPAAPRGPTSPFSPLSPGAPWGPGSPFSPLTPGGPWRPGSPFSPRGPTGPCMPGVPAGPRAPCGPGWRSRSANCLASFPTRDSSASRRSDADVLRETLGLAARTFRAWLFGAPRLAGLLLGLRAIAASSVNGDVGHVRYALHTTCAPPKDDGPLGITIPTGPSGSHAGFLPLALPPLRRSRRGARFNCA
jgi:hypothetical protein